jgi:4a-hydroxytetrahydrobiopterin dehydratase
MTTREKLSEEAISAFLTATPGWERRDGALARTFSFRDYGAGVAFAVRVALAAERRDHHPDIRLSWGQVNVAWSTHDAGGITALDVEMAKRTEELYAG